MISSGSWPRPKPRRSSDGRRASASAREANRRALAEAARDSPRTDPGPKPADKDGRTHEMLEGEAPVYRPTRTSTACPRRTPTTMRLPPAPAYDPDIDGATNWN